MSDLKNTRPEYRNINAITDLTTYRLPAAGWVSILHRVSGALMFLLMPFIVWMFDTSVSSEISFSVFSSALSEGVWGLPGFAVKLVLLGLLWAYLHHLLAGVRHLYMDATHAVSKKWGALSAVVVLVLSISLTATLGAKLFGLY